VSRKEQNFWIFLLILALTVVFVLLLAGLNTLQRRRLSGAARISFVDDCKYLLQCVAGFFLKG
jgi:hypothetical protein